MSKARERPVAGLDCRASRPYREAMSPSTISARVPGTRVLFPGLVTLAPGTERYRIRGGGATVLALRAGDRLEVTDPEGLQTCEIVAFGTDGRADAGLIGAEADQPATGLAAVLARAREDSRAAAAALARRGLVLGNARAVCPFERDAPAGSFAEFTAGADCVVVMAAPGGPAAVDTQCPPTDLIAVVRRVQPARAAEPALPEPLAEPVAEHPIPRATVGAFEVRAGEYIQVIDVAGRQCSDFLAFSAALLEGGVERGLDATTTRTLMAAAYPGPGLYSKFYDADMQPMVELVRDTCGRHDTFGLACTAKYYADMGYPGHVNCTDNFNAALASYGVAARRGWPAINFFYNTGIDDRNQLYLDEPWSRAGDYVLLRALTDLVCASSACPDDVDAANGWDPTDIHVRIYGGESLFTKAVAFRMTADAEPQLTRETGFHPRTSRLTRDFAEYRGYWLANSYTNHGAVAEYWACREAAAIMDLSPLRKFEVVGPDAEALLQATLTRDVSRLSVGQVVYSSMCYPSGGMVDDGTLFRLGRDNFRWIGGDEYGGQWLREQAAARALRVWVKSATDQLHNVALQGPKSRAILKDVVWTPPTQPRIDELGWFRFTIGRIGDFDGTAVIVSRTGYTGELGYEVWCHPDDAPAVWDALFEAGRPHGLLPLGLEALDMVRIEAGLVFFGAEFDDRTDPFEAGIGFTVPLASKNADFIGREALARRKAESRPRLVGLELAGEEPGAHGDGVYEGRGRVGVVTSGTRSPVLAKNIALARLEGGYTEPGTRLEVGKLDGHQKRIPAMVVPTPFYDPDKSRVRS